MKKNELSFYLKRQGVLSEMTVHFFIMSPGYYFSLNSFHCLTMVSIGMSSNSI